MWFLQVIRGHLCPAASLPIRCVWQTGFQFQSGGVRGVYLSPRWAEPIPPPPPETQVIQPPTLHPDQSEAPASSPSPEVLSPGASPPSGTVIDSEILPGARIPHETSGNSPPNQKVKTPSSLPLLKLRKPLASQLTVPTPAFGQCYPCGFSSQGQSPLQSLWPGQADPVTTRPHPTDEGAPVMFQGGQKSQGDCKTLGQPLRSGYQAATKPDSRRRHPSLQPSGALYRRQWEGRIGWNERAKRDHKREENQGLPFLFLHMYIFCCFFLFFL